MPWDFSPILANVGQDLLSDASYLWVIIFLILTGCGLPIPEEVGIIAAGVWAADGAVDFWLGLAACLFGCIVGDSIMYAIGYRFGKSVLREHPMFSGFLTPQREKHIEWMIRRRGAAVLFTARFLVGVRGPVYLTAGILHFPYRRFLVIDLACATIVVSLFYSLAWYYGQGIMAWIRTAEEGITIAIVIGVAMGAVFFWLHHRRSKQMLDTLDRASDAISPDDESQDTIAREEVPTRNAAENEASIDGTVEHNGKGEEHRREISARERWPGDP